MAEPLRVLVVDHVAGVKGFRAGWERLAGREDLDLTLFVPETWIEGGREVHAPSAGAAAGYRLRTGRALWRGKENRAFFVSGVFRALLGARPDVLHLQEEPFSMMALQWTLACRLLRPRARITFYTFDNLHRGFRYPYRPSWAYGLVQRIVQALAHAGVAAGSEAARVLRSRGFSKPVRFVPPGVEPAPGRGALAERRATGPLVVGFVGRLLPMKGLSVLVDALSRTDADWSLLVVGEGPERARLERAGFGERLRISGGVAHAEVPALLASLDVLVLPSRSVPWWKEQFGRVLTEAMAAGVVVVGSDCGAIPEVIGPAGMVFPEGDSRALAAALELLAREPAERARLAEGGRRRVREHFLWDRVAEAYRILWQDLARGEAAGEIAPRWAPGPS